MSMEKGDGTDIVLRDVTLRDGLQLTGGVMSAEWKVELVRRLRSLGISAIEVGSMARPDLVPPMANTVEVLQQLTSAEREDCYVWVATPKQVQRAVDAGARKMQYCLSVSDAHNRANVARDTEASMAALPDAVEAAAAAGAELQFCLATSFTCPFDGEVDPVRVVDLVADPRTEGCTDVVIADTLGQADPVQVHALIRSVRDVWNPDHHVVFHGHDTWGLGVANSLAAVGAGASMVDGALAGLGGCPFAPGASGNTATEDLLFAAKPTWLSPEVFKHFSELGQRVAEDTSEPNRARSYAGAHARAEAFAWVV